MDGIWIFKNSIPFLTCHHKQDGWNTDYYAYQEGVPLIESVKEEEAAAAEKKTEEYEDGDKDSKYWMSGDEFLNNDGESEKYLLYLQDYENKRNKSL